MRNNLVFFVLKAANLVLITVYNFAVVYILSRVVGTTNYPLVVSVAAIGSYVVATDLGYSGYVYFETRRCFIAGRLADQEKAISEALWLYLGLAVFAGLCGVVVILAVAHASFELRVALGLFFVSVVLPLPWMLLRKVAAAIDYFLEFEICELVRRTAFLALSVAMLVGVPFVYFGGLCILAWIISFAVAVSLIARQGLRLSRTTPRALIQHVDQNRAKIFKSGTLSMLEFVIYNLPYLVIPMLFRSGAALVAFDLFYKVSRFGALAYGVPAEAALPHQTRAYYAGNWRNVWLLFGGIVAIGAVVCVCASAVVLGFGGPIFAFLLAKAGVVTPAVRWAMVGMLAAMVLQIGAGTFLVNTGLQGRLAKLSLITCTLLVALAVVQQVAGLSFDVFLGGYVAAYGVHTALYVGCFVWFMARSRSIPVGEALAKPA